VCTAAAAVAAVAAANMVSAAAAVAAAAGISPSPDLKQSFFCGDADGSSGAFADSDK
jgi:hypothetical protein